MEPAGVEEEGSQRRPLAILAMASRERERAQMESGIG